MVPLPVSLIYVERLLAAQAPKSRNASIVPSISQYAFN